MGTSGKLSGTETGAIACCLGTIASRLISSSCSSPPLSAPLSTLFSSPSPSSPSPSPSPPPTSERYLTPCHTPGPLPHHWPSCSCPTTRVRAGRALPTGARSGFLLPNSRRRRHCKVLPAIRQSMISGLHVGGLQLETLLRWAEVPRKDRPWDRPVGKNVCPEICVQKAAE